MRRTNVTDLLFFIALFVAMNLEVHAQTWSFTGSMQQARLYLTATLLMNGQILIVGRSHRGVSGISQAELYNPATGAFSATGSLNTGRYGHTATLRPNGKVLIAGGSNSSGALSSAELYDPATGTLSVTRAFILCGRAFA